jgi:integrase
MRFWTVSLKSRAPATANLYLDMLRACLKRAGDIRDPVTRQPALAHVPAVPGLAVPKRRARPVPDVVLAEIIETVPKHTADAILLTLYFGFRRGEVFGLEIHQVDFEAKGVRQFAERVKDNEDTFLPAARAALALLEQLVQQARARNTTYLITWRCVASVPAKTGTQKQE